MNETTKELVSGIGAIEYGVLKETFCKLEELHTLYGAMYEKITATAEMPDFNQLQAVHILLDDLFKSLERFMLPVCASEETCGTPMCSH